MTPPRPATFSNEELQSLTRAWISVASDHPASETANGRFWDHVGVEYAVNASPAFPTRTAEQLQRQWKVMCPSMVAVVTLFGQKCQHLSSGATGEADAFAWAVETFRRSTKKPFAFAGTLWLLVSQKAWWKVLKPHFMQQFALILDEEDAELGLQEQQQEPATEPEESVLSESLSLDDESQELPLSLVCGASRLRSGEEDEEDTRERRVRPRLVSEDVPSLTPVEEVLEALQKTESLGSVLLKGSSTSSSRPGYEEAEVKTREVNCVMEQRLELDIMTQSEDGLSLEAQEYLCLRRREILMKLREKIEQRLP
jgi:hypothetical protein